MRTDTRWGYWEVLFEKPPNLKIKRLVVNPGCHLSYQKHFKRNENWQVISGSGRVKLCMCPELGEPDLIKWLKSYKELKYGGGDIYLAGHYDRTETCNVYIPATMWHQLINDGKELLEIIEIQIGENCVEEDIERKGFDILP